MFGFLLVLGLGAAAVAYRQSPEDIAGDLPAKLSSKLDKLWEIAQESLKAQKYLRAEKALLTILRIDAKNTNAYNRLGILYAKQHAYDDAIECFEIAQSLEPSASSLHNVGLIYYETESYEKAALAFEQALEMEEEVASRHIAYGVTSESGTWSDIGGAICSAGGGALFVCAFVGVLAVRARRGYGKNKD